MKSFFQIVVVLSIGSFAASCGNDSATTESTVHRGNFTNAQLCTAGIAMMNSQSVDILSIVPSSSTIVVAYKRPSDGKNFEYGCRVEGGQIRWKDSATGRWNKNNKLFYNVVANTVTIEQKVGESSFGKESYSIEEL